MKYTFTYIVIILSVSLVSDIIFKIIYDKFDIQEKFFKFFAKNKLRYYSIFAIFWIVLLLLLIILPKYNKYLYIPIFIYFSSFAVLYQIGFGWRSFKNANNVYIKNIDKLNKAKRKYKNKKKI